MIKVRSGVRAGGSNLNHNQKPLKVRSGVRAGGTNLNHNQKARKNR